jgi:hypothetical protein
MKLYHASSLSVEKPDTINSREFLDFGRGFYLTTIHEQACFYAQRFLRRNLEAWVNVYELTDDLVEWKILTFESYDKEWLDFVAKCRRGEPTEDYDMIVGGIANDKVILTLDLFFSGKIGQDEALGRLRFEKPNIQYCIRSEKMLNECLTFIESKRL